MFITKVFKNDTENSLLLMRKLRKNTVHFMTTENLVLKTMIRKAGGVNDTGTLLQKVARVSRKSQAKVPKGSKKKTHVKESRAAAKEKLSRSLLHRLFTTHFLKQYTPLCVINGYASPQTKNRSSNNTIKTSAFAEAALASFLTSSKYSYVKHQICLL